MQQETVKLLDKEDPLFLPMMRTYEYAALSGKWTYATEFLNKFDELFYKIYGELVQ